MPQSTIAPNAFLRHGASSRWGRELVRRDQLRWPVLTLDLPARCVNIRLGLGLASTDDWVTASMWLPLPSALV